jgi:hypothetical protein
MRKASLTQRWRRLDTAFGKRPDGTYGPLENIVIEAEITPA